MSANLIDRLMEVTNSSTHAELCEKLEIQAPTISKIYNGKLYPGPVIIIRMHEVSDLPIRELLQLRGPKPCIKK